MNSHAGTRRIKCAGGTHDPASRQHDRALVTTVRGEYHGPTMVASGPVVPSLLERCVLCSFWFRGSMDHLTWAYWASFATPLDLVDINFLLFS